MNWLTNAYTWFWKNFLHLPKALSWYVVDSMKAHLVLWQVVGAFVVAGIWVLVCHFIAMN